MSLCIAKNISEDILSEKDFLIFREQKEINLFFTKKENIIKYYESAISSLHSIIFQMGLPVPSTIHIRASDFFDIKSWMNSLLQNKTAEEIEEYVLRALKFERNYGFSPFTKPEFIKEFKYCFIRYLIEDSELSAIALEQEEKIAQYTDSIYRTYNMIYKIGIRGIPDLSDIMSVSISHLYPISDYYNILLINNHKYFTEKYYNKNIDSKYLEVPEWMSILSSYGYITEEYTANLITKSLLNNKISFELYKEYITKYNLKLNLINPDLLKKINPKIITDKKIINKFYKLYPNYYINYMIKSANAQIRLLAAKSMPVGDDRFLEFKDEKNSDVLLYAVCKASEDHLPFFLNAGKVDNRIQDMLKYRV